MNELNRNSIRKAYDKRQREKENVEKKKKEIKGWIK